MNTSSSRISDPIVSSQLASASARFRVRLWIPLLSVLFALLLGTSACGGEAGPTGDARYAPSTDGFSWTYRARRDGISSTVTARLDGTEALGGLTLQRLRVTSEDGTGVLLGRIDQSSVRLHSARFLDQTWTFETPLELVRFPFELGDRFRTESRVDLGLISAQITVQSEVVGFGPISVLGRTYQDTFRFQGTVELRALGVTLRVPSSVWLAPDVGPVRGEFEVADNPVLPISGSIQIELEEAVP